MQEFRSNGKILLTGEYAVLNGAKSLALPTKAGQVLKVSEGEKNIISWTSFDENDQIWFQSELKIDDGNFTIIDSPETANNPEIQNIQKRLQQILKAAFQKNPSIFQQTGYTIHTHLDFNRQWGLGTSSTLINNIAQWLNIDPYKLLHESFGGSGYDIAAAKSDLPITYQITENKPVSFTADFNPEFKENLFFVYLNRKQNSREAIAHYRNQPDKDLKSLTEKISGITEQIIQCDNLEEFKLLLKIHETLISKAINLPRIQNELFPDYPELIKSLGGWGGDFILATGTEQEKEYFRNKGYNTIFGYQELIK
ncbi:GYDIA family GHMP kinase [Christiangramia sp. SM2212]|uniref:GYDIA family GHMP kinase n=1 Tax=Christiangramia sediminicola TaxID=3073267 RepID=A0ABU1EU70_9FLAO|nr:GYDIA family GHMP kinase [Christiangramia sp. SM2212]MDR5591948.1 GYDIA family GHMP kinase [Christiangramia sp. SM2212]